MPINILWKEMLQLKSYYKWLRQWIAKIFAETDSAYLLSEWIWLEKQKRFSKDQELASLEKKKKAQTDLFFLAVNMYVKCNNLLNRTWLEFQ